MFYRLAFNITHDGYLKVMASAKGFPGCSAVHLNDSVFAAVVNAAGFGPLQSLRLIEAAREARIYPDLEICCEVVELSDQQLQTLCLQAPTSKLA
jgi:hypothetical protein